MMRVELLTETDALDPLVPAWDALAVAAGVPQLAPAWVIAWLRHLAPADALTRVVTVHDGDELIGVAPFSVTPERFGTHAYRLPGYELSVSVPPLARASRAWEVAEAVAGALAAADPAPDAVVLEALPLASLWVEALRDRWPGPLRPVVRTRAIEPFLTAALEGRSYDDWLAARGTKFRRELQRKRRRFVEAGGTRRLADAGSLAADVETFRRLHVQRWKDIGSSALAVHGERLAPMLTEAGAQLVDDGRMRLAICEIEGEPACAELSIAAGGVVLGVNIGWDDRWRRLSLPQMSMASAIEDAFARGERRFELGFGGQHHKLPLADGDDPISWSTLLAPGRRLPLGLAAAGPQMARGELRNAADRALTPAQVTRLRELLRRGG